MQSCSSFTNRGGEPVLRAETTIIGMTVHCLLSAPGRQQLFVCVLWCGVLQQQHWCATPACTLDQLVFLGRQFQDVCSGVSNLTSVLDAMEVLPKSQQTCQNRFAGHS